MISNYEIQVWDGSRMRGSKVHAGAHGSNARMLCGYWGSERVTMVATVDPVTCKHCVNRWLTQLTTERADLRDADPAPGVPR